MPLIRELATMLEQYPGLIELVVGAFIGWRSIVGVTNLFSALNNITSLLKGMPNLIRGIPPVTPPGTPGVPPVAPIAAGSLALGAGIAGAVAGPALIVAANSDSDRYNADQQKLWEQWATTPADQMTQEKLNEIFGPMAKLGMSKDELLEAKSTFDTQTATGNAASGNNYGVGTDDDGEATREKGRKAAEEYWKAHPDEARAKGIPGYKTGGPTRAGLAVLHDDEFVLSDRASKYPDSFKQALNEGKIDPSSIRFMEPGGAPEDMPPGGPAPIAPNTAGGGIFDAITKAITGIGGPIDKATSGAPSWTAIPGLPGIPVPPVPSPDGLQVAPGVANPTQYRFAPSVTPTDTAPAATSTGGVPHLTGATPGPLDGVPHLTGATPGPGAGADAPTGLTVPTPTSPFDFSNRRQVWQNPDGTTRPLDQILGGLPDKLKPLNIGAQFGQALLGGVLGFFGLGTSILSPNNPWNQALQQGFGGLFGTNGGAYDPNVVNDVLTQNGSPNGNYTGGTGAPGTFSENPNTKVLGRFPASPPDITGALAASLGNPTLYATSGPNAYQVPDWAQKLAGQFGLKASTYADGDTLHQAGYAFDFGPLDPSDPEGATKMDAFADYLQTNLSGQTLQLIHRDVNSGKEWRVAGGQRVGPGTAAPGYFNANMAGHGDHVHWATDIAPVFNDPNQTGGQALADGGASTSAANAILYPRTLWGTDMGGADLKSKAQAAYLAAGMPPGEWSAFDQLIQHESSWVATNKNPGSTAYGLGQFLDSTWATVGGTKTDDPMQQLQYIFAYLKQRPDYGGSPAKAWALWQSRSPHWYANGGGVWGGTPGRDSVPGMLMPGEHVLTTRDVAAMGGQSEVYKFRNALHFADGGGVPLGLRLPEPRPVFNTPPIKQMVPRPAVQAPTPRPAPVAPVAPTPAAPAAPAPSGLPAEPIAPQQQEQAPVGGPAPTGAAPDSSDHVLPAISKGISSGFATAGAIAQTAAAIGTMGATAGMGGGLAAAGAGGGGGGPSIQGLFQQAGKIATGVANVASSFLVGNITPGNDPGGAYGTTLVAPQRDPQTAPLDSSRQFVFNGIDGRNVVDDLRLKDSQDMQAELARW